MESTLLLALLVALGSGVAIGVQSNLTNLSGQSVRMRCGPDCCSTCSAG